MTNIFVKNTDKSLCFVRVEIQCIICYNIYLRSVPQKCGILTEKPEFAFGTMR